VSSRGPLLVTLLSACAASPRPPAPAAPAPAPPPTTEVSASERLARYLSGRFDSSEQAQRDAEFRHIVLNICPVTAPDLGAHVLYVEQAAAETVAQPYRQRLYVIDQDARDAQRASSRVFELVAPAAAVGSCEREGPIRFLATDAIERSGCTVSMTWDGVQFHGGTSGETCLSSLRGATYATTTVTLDRERLHSWDRGFDSAGAQVWGATKGAYEFVRRTPPPSTTEAKHLVDTASQR
jgi:CpeT protein